MTDAWPEERGFTVFYRHCGVSWQDHRSCPCNGECPVCGKEIEPYDWENTTRLPSRKVRYDRRSIFHDYWNAVSEQPRPVSVSSSAR